MPSFSGAFLPPIANIPSLTTEPQIPAKLAGGALSTLWCGWDGRCSLLDLSFAGGALLPPTIPPTIPSFTTEPQVPGELAGGELAGDEFLPPIATVPSFATELQMPGKLAGVRAALVPSGMPGNLAGEFILAGGNMAGVRVAPKDERRYVLCVLKEGSH